MSPETQTRTPARPPRLRSAKSGAFGIFRRTLKYIGILILGAIVFYGALVLFFPIEFIQTVDDDSSLPSITFDGYTFHSETFGNPENPIVVALHGGPGGDYRYMLPLEELSDDYFVIMYDQREVAWRRLSIVNCAQRRPHLVRTGAVQDGVVRIFVRFFQRGVEDLDERRPLARHHGGKRRDADVKGTWPVRRCEVRRGGHQMTGKSEYGEDGQYEAYCESVSLHGNSPSGLR